MNDGVLGALSTAQLLRRSWKVFRSHLWLFVPLMGFPVCTLVLGSAVLLLLFPEPQGVPLQEAFEHSSTLNEISVVLVFLGSVALLYHVFGVTMWAAGEFLASRDVGMWQAIRHFGGKQARLFWALFLAGLLTRSTSGILPLVVRGWKRDLSLRLRRSDSTIKKCSRQPPFFSAMLSARRCLTAP